MPPSKFNTRKFVSTDPNKCTGCSLCEYVCTLEKDELLWNPLRSRIRVMRLTPAFNVAMTCRFCEHAPCINACSRKALTQSEGNGILVVDEDKCDGCGWCIQACPYGGIMLHPDKGTVVACDLCGGDPKCIEFCPEEALELVSDDQAAEKKWTETIDRIPSEAQRLACLIKKTEWASVFAEAEERARRLTAKLEEINRSFGKQKSKLR